MRRLALGCAVVLAACTSSGDQDADTTMGAGTTAAAVPPATSAAATLADRVGTWDGRSMEGDSVVATWRQVVPSDSGGWTLTFPEGQPIPMRLLSSAGDSVVTEFGPFESPVSGEQVTVRAVGRMEGRDRQLGTYEVRPATMPDSVVTRGRWEATRVP
jgi:hypothetical protein